MQITECVFIIIIFFIISAKLVVSEPSVILLNIGTVLVMWEPTNFNILHYTVYYNSTNDIRSINFTSTATNGTINGLTNNATNYVFRISATYEVSSDVYQEGPSSPSVSPGMPFSIIQHN